MAIAEFTPQGTLIRANGNFHRMLGYDGEDLRGRHHRSFCPSAVVERPDYAHFWPHLQAGNAHSGIEERVRRDGSSCWLEATYTPVLDSAGQVTEVLKVATDITVRLTQHWAQQERFKRLSLVADVSDTAVLITDSDARIAYTNAGFERMFGWREDEVKGRNPVELLAPHMDEQLTAQFYEELYSTRSLQREEILRGKQGQRYWAKVVCNPIYQDGQLQHTVTLLTDITQAKMHEALQHRVLEAMAREQPLTEVLELICLEVERIAPDITASILEVNAQGQLYSLAAPNLPAAYCREINGLSIGPAIGSCGTAAWRNDVVRVDDIASDPLWADFRELALPLGLTGCWSTPIRNSQGCPIGTFAFYFRERRNASAEVFHQRLVDACTHLCTLALERENARQRIRQLAYYDGLTGMPNRSLLQARADQAIASAARNNEHLAVLFIDLDRFKQVNDSLGHPAGDELLCQVAKRMQAGLKALDIAGRLSGDEFVVVLADCDAERATDVVERLQALISQPMTIAQTQLSVSASVGIAVFPCDGRDMETLLHRADMAMYQAKHNGRAAFSFFSSEMNRLAQERLALETALRDALANHRLHLEYQPQIELGSGRLYGIEALARWTHPQLGVIAPTRFIPLAEECGLVAQLGHWAVDEACRQLAEWRHEGLRVPAVAVNLSPTSFHNLNLPQRIDATLRKHGLVPADLTLELTENILLDTNPSTLKTIEAVHALGIRLSMDDFGTGYSSLSYLRRLPVSELKLDRSFVADLAHDEAARALSSAILGIGKSLNLTVVAEGVESELQNDLLQAQGYPVAQGYLFSRPLTPTALRAWLKAR